MQHPTRRTLTISKIEPRQTSPNGHHHLDCETDAGIVAFWGSEHNLLNIQVIEKWFLTQMCARFSPSRSAAPWEEGADALVPANQR